MNCPKCGSTPRFITDVNIQSIMVSKEGVFTVMNLQCRICGENYSYDHKSHDYMLKDIQKIISNELNYEIREGRRKEHGLSNKQKVQDEIDQLLASSGKFCTHTNWFSQKAGLCYEETNIILNELCSEGIIKQMTQISCPECDSGLATINHNDPIPEIENCDICEYEGDEWKIAPKLWASLNFKEG